MGNRSYNSPLNKAPLRTVTGRGNDPNPNWVPVKESNLSYHNKETLYLTIDPYFGNLSYHKKETLYLTLDPYLGNRIRFLNTRAQLNPEAGGLRGSRL